MKTADLVTIRLVQTPDGGITAEVTAADWLDMISVTQANALLKMATDNLEALALSYYIRSQGPEGTGA